MEDIFPLGPDVSFVVLSLIPQFNNVNDYFRESRVPKGAWGHQSVLLSSLPPESKQEVIGLVPNSQPCKT